MSTNFNQHDPWTTSSSNRNDSHSCHGQGWEADLRRCGASFISHFRRIAGWWVSRITSLWRRADIPGRLGSVGLCVAGILGLVMLAHILLYVIPLLILAAFIAAIWTAVRTNLGTGGYPR